MLVRSLSTAFALSLLAAATTLTGPAQAEDESPEAEEEEAPPTFIPYRRDSVGGHFQIGASGNLVMPFGSVSKDVGTRERAGIGGGAAGDLSFGLNRFVALGVYGEMALLDKSALCSDCRANFLAAGGFFRYHLSQGLKFDPWLSYGFGFTVLGPQSNAGITNYAGLDWMRLTAGANWFASTSFAVGPVIGLHLGHMIDRPPAEKVGGPVTKATFGLRFVFDTPRRL